MVSLRAGLGMAIVAGSCSVAAADLYEFRFTGFIDLYRNVNAGSILEPVQFGDPWELVYRFDSAAPDQEPGNPTYGIYAMSVIRMTVGPLAYDGPGPGQIAVIDDDFLMPAWVDGFISLFELPNALLGDLILYGPEGPAPRGPFASDSLPTVLDLGWFPQGSRQFLVEDRAAASAVSGDVRGFESRLVPGPGGLGILACLGLAVRRRRGG